MLLDDNMEKGYGKYRITNTLFASLKVKDFNLNYFDYDYELVKSCEFVFVDFLQFRAQCLGKKNLDILYFYPNLLREISLINFFEFSVKNDFILDNWLKEEEYIIDKDHVFYKNMDLVNKGQIEFEEYLINFSGTYLFIECLISKKKYVYYTD